MCECKHMLINIEHVDGVRLTPQNRRPPTGLLRPVLPIKHYRHCLEQWFSSVATHAATEIVYAFILKCQIFPLRMLPTR
jgi:hypothetical protein